MSLIKRRVFVKIAIPAILTPRCGEKAADVLKSADIKLYKTIPTSIKDNINDYVDGKLSLLGEIHAGFHGHEGK
jgi:predicted Fe-Mo cluster-binding NifX family protein